MLCPYFSSDNAKLWQYLQQGVKGTSVKQQVDTVLTNGVKDGHQAIINFRASYCNPKVWQKRACQALDSLAGTTWSDNGTITLSTHASTHWNLY